MEHNQSETSRKEGVTIDSLGLRPIETTLPSGPQIKISYLSAEAEEVLARLLEVTPGPREFLITFINELLMLPKLTREQIALWSDEDLTHVAAVFAKKEFGKTLDSNEDTYAQFMQYAQSHSEEVVESIRSTLNNFAHYYLESIKPVLDQSQRIASLVPPFGDLRHINLPEPRNILIDPAELNRIASRLTYFDDTLDTSLKALRSQAATMAKVMSSSALRSIEDQSTLIADAIKSIHTDFAESIIGRSISSVEGLKDSLPHIAEALRRVAKARNGVLALENSGFGYSTTLWKMEFLLELAELEEEGVSAAVSESIHTFTESQEYADELFSLLNASPLMLKRVQAVEEAITNHLHGRYFASVALLLPQVEGVLNDILTSLEAVLQFETKLYERNSDGSRGRELRGLDSKSHLAKRVASLNGELAKFITGTLVPERNGILHGVDCSFGTSDRSVHLLLVLLSLAVAANELDLSSI